MLHRINGWKEANSLTGYLAAHSNDHQPLGPGPDAHSDRRERHDAQESVKLLTNVTMLVSIGRCWPLHG